MKGDLPHFANIRDGDLVRYMRPRPRAGWVIAIAIAIGLVIISG